MINLNNQYNSWKFW